MNYQIIYNSYHILIAIRFLNRIKRLHIPSHLNKCRIKLHSNICLSHTQHLKYSIELVLQIIHILYISLQFRWIKKLFVRFTWKIISLINHQSDVLECAERLIFIAVLLFLMGCWIFSELLCALFQFGHFCVKFLFF